MSDRQCAVTVTCVAYVAYGTLESVDLLRGLHGIYPHPQLSYLGSPLMLIHSDASGAVAELDLGT